MVEFKIELEEHLVQIFGYEKIEKSLQGFSQRILLKMAAQDILEELPEIDLENDEEWKLARELAWAQEKHKYAA